MQGIWPGWKLSQLSRSIQTRFSTWQCRLRMDWTPPTPSDLFIGILNQPISLSRSGAGKTAKRLRQLLKRPYSRRRRCFCPSCHQKRALLFAEHVDEDLLGDLPVRQYVVTIPKMLRLCFKYDRKLLGLLSQCFYASVKELFQDAAGDRRSLPGMIASLQSYGDDPTRFHPHLHSLVTDGLVLPE